ncbi:thiamine phosphate synthase [Streptococcus sp. SL1232]|uniref:thiamine phosphate synthase n=1 Tax=Streptococcus vicugnae TaxID=2740579 RepID=UPI0018F70D74|nr:thiamine phosphate synthase [Streptococcus vicugnae]
MNKEQLQVYFICGTQNCPKGKFLGTLEAAFKSGVTCFQFREKGQGALVGQEKTAMALKVKELCQKYHVLFLINDDIDLALQIGVDGVHIGQDDMPVRQVRKLFPDKIIGLSVGNSKEFYLSDIEKVDYIGVGPVFPTSSKSDAGQVIGLKGLREMRKLDPKIPIVAIGGITFGDVAAIRQTGADGVAVISALAQSEQIELDTQRFARAFD